MKIASPLSLIFIGVCTAHLLFLSYVYTPERAPAVKKRPTVLVQTVSLTSPPLATATAHEELSSPLEEEPEASPPPPQKKQQKPAPKKEVAKAEKAAPKKEVAKVEKAAPQKTTLSPSQKKKLEKVKNALADLNVNTSEIKKSTRAVQLSTENFSFDSLSQGEIGYADLLVSRLKSSLTLPEYGAVKIQLVLRKNGQVEEVKILDSESKRNETAILKTIKTISFPSFGKYFEGENRHSFTITLTNDR